MPVIAVSLSESNFRELEALQKLGFSNRSHVIRHALQNLLASQRTLETLSGQVTAVIIVAYEAGKSGECSQILHGHNKILSSVMHTHSENGVCIDILVTNGESEAIRTLLWDLRMQRFVEQIFVTILGGQ